MKSLLQACTRQVRAYCNTSKEPWRSLATESLFTTQNSMHFSCLLSFLTSRVCAIQETSTQDTAGPHTSKNVADLSRGSMSRQYSLRSQQSAQSRRRSTAPPGPAPQSWTASAKAAEDTAPSASDGTTSKEEKGMPGQEGASASSQQTRPLSQVPQSPFEQWRAGGDSAHRDQPKVHAH